MRASIIVAAHTEGQSLWKTIRSCVESIGKLDRHKRFGLYGRDESFRQASNPNVA